MAIFKGRDELIKNLQDSVRSQDIKGIEAEIEVGDLLSKYLPNDTYIIAQPEIGELHPDFLVISPMYGFRLIEVKNLNIRYIEETFSNGWIRTKFGNRNPLEQVKSHADALKNYLVSNYSNIGIADPYKYIGYCVIHKGFSRREFEYKFAYKINKWSLKEKESYNKYHLYFEEINSQISQFLEKATKFPNKNFPLQTNHLHLIAESIKSSSNRQDDGYFETIDQQEERIENVNTEVQKIKESIQTYQVKSSQSIKNLLVYFVVGIAIIVVAIMFVSTSKDLGNDVSQENNSNDNFNSIEDLQEFVYEYVKIEAKVIRFYFDENSGTKFLTLSNGNQEIESVIFKGTKVPFIEEGSTYVFEGYIQPTKDSKDIELKITAIK